MGERQVTKPNAQKKRDHDELRKQREIRRQQRGRGTEADWSAADPDKVVRCIANVASSGCAIQFGYTQDGGTYVVRFVGDGDPRNEFIRATEDIDLFLDSTIEIFAP